MRSTYCNSLSPAVSLELRAGIVDTATMGLYDVFLRVQVADYVNSLYGAHVNITCYA
ncbi:hypothetical protein X975_24571, partial [Stegodyphus mimosarum]